MYLFISIYLFIHLCIHLSIHPFIYSISNHLFINLFIDLSFIHFFSYKNEFPLCGYLFIERIIALPMGIDIVNNSVVNATAHLTGF